jgi:hypothetical protein
MIKGKIHLEGKPEAFISVYESNDKGVPLKRNNKYINTETNELGEYVLNVPVSPSFYLTARLVGTNQQTFSTDKVPAVINLKSLSNLPEIEVTAKKRNYWWLLLLLLIPIILKKKRKK